MNYKVLEITRRSELKTLVSLKLLFENIYFHKFIVMTLPTMGFKFKKILNIKKSNIINARLKDSIKIIQQNKQNYIFIGMILCVILNMLLYCFKLIFTCFSILDFLILRA